MPTYRVVDVHHGRRTAIFDDYGRMVELIAADITNAQLAALMTQSEQAGAYRPARFSPQRVFDSVSEKWTDVEWPVEE